MVLDRVAATPSDEAFRHPVQGADGGESWQSLTWGETGERVTELAAGLISLGVRAEDRVAVWSATRLEWVLADLAINTAGGATTTIYPSTLPDDVAHILADSGAVVAFVEDDTKLAVLRDLAGKLPDLRTVVTVDGTPDGDRVLALDELAERGRRLLAESPGAVTERVDEVEPEHLATLIYTSGTTGRPKGVRLVHDNWAYEGAAVEQLGILRPDDLQYLWLPLSHSFGKVLLAAQLQIGFATAVDGRIERIVENLAVVRPTFMAGAPRIFEKVHNRVVQAVEAEGGVKAKLFGWAFGVGRQVSALRQQRRRPGPLLAVRHAVADRLVFSTLRGRFGGRLRYFVSGSAALSRDVAEWFHAAGLLVLEGYGLTETSAAAFVNRPDTFRFGTVGPALPGTEVRLASDGEVLLRGPGIMRGYHNLPETTAETLDPDGWLHTGDVGALDDDGLLRITDRKKDLIKTSGGKYVAPQGIETRFKAVCPYASQIVVHGDGRNFITALITLDADAMATWAQANGMAGRRYEEVVTSPQARAMVEQHVAELNAGLGRWETIKRFEILPRELTVEDGDLTPSLKLKRRVVEKRYAEVLDAFYRG
jgi:long-chain acyl-CoA synthetase